MSEKISILVVDDEAPLVRLMQAFLERSGYSVEAFTNAADALNRFKAEPDLFRIVVTDITLPDTPGDELAITMARLNPSVRVLLCSGYPFAVDSLPEDVRPRFAMLDKPFLGNMLTGAVAELLGRK
jgi:DNA-binding NtrC family response regulator